MGCPTSDFHHRRQPTPITGWPKPRFRIGQLVHVDGNIDYVWRRHYYMHPWKHDGETFEAGWWYKMRYPGDCVKFHESALTAIRPAEIAGPK
jgi:hypothetical protein